MTPIVESVGMVGLGRLGLAIACRLRQAGIPVNAFNRSMARGAELHALGGTLMTSPAAVAEASEIVLTAVTGPKDVTKVILGSDGVRDGARPGLIVADLSTIDPSTSRSIASKLGQQRVKMLDTPVSGSIHAAKAGTLGLLVGGEVESLEQASPELQKLGSHIYHFGPNGSGCTAKLALNLLVGAMAQGLAESMAVLGRLGLSRQMFLDAVSTSGLSSPLYERVGQRALDSDFHPRFAFRDLHKDILLFCRIGKDAGIEFELARKLRFLLARELVEFGPQDYSALIAAVAKRTLNQRSQRRNSTRRST